MKKGGKSTRRNHKRKNSRKYHHKSTAKRGLFEDLMNKTLKLRGG